FYHVGRSSIPVASPPLHTHDFCEVFWIERGYGWHLINGERLPLEPGDVQWILPADAHAFRARDEKGFVLLNVAFSRETLEFLRERYLGKSSRPVSRRFDPGEVNRVSRWAEALVTGRQTRLRLEAFLLNLFQLGAADHVSGTDTAYPVWLQE